MPAWLEGICASWALGEYVWHRSCCATDAVCMIPRYSDSGFALDNQNNLPVIHNPLAGRRLTRREMVQRVLAGLGAALALPRILTGHPIHRHLANASKFVEAEVKAAAAEWTPQFLDSQQNETFASLAERIVPGSTAAQVNRVVDLLLTVDTAENQESFRASLSALDRESQTRFGHPFKTLAVVQQDELLTLASTGGGEKSKDDSPEDKPEQSRTLRDHFENLKGWIVGTYYASEIGMRELGWTDDFYYDNAPGCPHTEEHH